MFLENHYQNAYVCDDIDVAIDVFRRRGIGREPAVFTVDQPVNTPGGQVINRVKLSFIWIGNLQYELIQPVLDPLGVYANCASASGPLRFHHICMRVHDWEAFRATIDRQNLPLVFEWDGGEGRVKFLYLDGRSTFGHYLEYAWMPDEVWARNLQR